MEGHTPFFTCPRCLTTSYNENDVKHGYCGRCHDFTGLDPEVCDRCGQRYGGSHYHCGSCDSPAVTGFLGHSLFGKMTCHMTEDEVRELVESRSRR
jgi:hypothetical protein